MKRVKYWEQSVRHDNPEQANRGFITALLDAISIISGAADKLQSDVSHLNNNKQRRGIEEQEEEQH